MAIWDFLPAAIELLLTALGYSRFTIRRGQSRSWPVAQGTIQSCRVEKGLNFLAPFRYYSVFGYAFKANGSRYAGFFALPTDDEDSAVALQKQAPGTTVTVRYKSNNPDVSLLEDEQILGRRIIQNPHLLR
jgi:hypothetical protein